MKTETDNVHDEGLGRVEEADQDRRGGRPFPIDATYEISLDGEFRPSLFYEPWDFVCFLRL